MILKTLSFLKSSTRMSLMRLQEYSGISIEMLKKYLHLLENENKVIKIENMREMSCNDCGSVRISPNFFCSSCNGSNFKQGKLIEHFKCGNVSVDESYENNICPKCKKEIKILGVDYKSIENYYICNDCGNKFPELSQDFTCVKCNNRFRLEQVKWVTSDGYKINN